MEYLFLKRKKTTAASERQKVLLFKAAEQQWEKQFASAVTDGRKVDNHIYKGILYQLEIRQVFLDPRLSLQKLSAMIDTNQTYLSNVVNRYFGCNLKELVNTYRVQYAKELLCADRYPLEEIFGRCGFASKSAFYAAFNKMTGTSPLHYQLRERRKRALHLQEEMIPIH